MEWVRRMVTSLYCCPETFLGEVEVEMLDQVLNLVLVSWGFSAGNAIWSLWFFSLTIFFSLLLSHFLTLSHTVEKVLSTSVV